MWRIESPVPEIQQIRIRRIPNRKLNGNIVPCGARGRLILTRKGSVYTDMVPHHERFVSLKRSPHYSSVLVEALHMAGAITEEQAETHARAAQEMAVASDRRRWADELERHAELLGIVLTKAQRRKAGLKGERGDSRPD